jgi:hypothetical protein
MISASIPASLSWTADSLWYFQKEIITYIHLLCCWVN